MHRFVPEPCAKSAQVRLSRMAVQHELWGSETTKAVENFPVSGRARAAPVVRWLGRIKGAAARVNAELGLLDARRRGARSRRPATRSPPASTTTSSRSTSSRPAPAPPQHERERGDREPRRRGRAPERPREHGPVVERRVPDGGPPGGARRRPDELLPALEQLAASLSRKAERVRGRRQGRPHPPDGRRAVTLGQEFGGYAAQIQLGHDRVSRTRSGAPSQIPLGGTATGTGLNAHPEFAATVRERLRRSARLPSTRFEAQASATAWWSCTGH